MKFWFTYPLLSHPSNPELMSRRGIVALAQAAERAGIAGIGFTDHPAPSGKWLAAGGHDALDPFVALAAVAVATETIRLIPNVVVLPYRNPFLVAKAAASLDVLSEGRFTLSVATGYLRSEYRALGVDFDDRNAIFDEALQVLRGVWSQDEFAFDGTRFSAGGVSANPKPSRRLPIWIGGNSPVSRRRVVDYGDGWNPFPAPPALARTARTVPLETLDDLGAMVEDLWACAEKAGRDPATIDVAFTTGLAGAGQPDFSASAHLAVLERMGRMGITWSSVPVPGDSLSHALEAVDRYAREVIAGCP